MKLTLLISLLLTLLTTQFVFAQTTIRGTITGSDKQPIPGLSVTVNDMSLKHILAFTFTNNKGQYALNFRSKQDSVILKISGMTIHPINYRIKNKKAVRNVQVTIKDMKLREVDVKSNKMWINGDTVNFNVSAYMGKKDLVIGDVLKKLPGITIRKNGQILWHGKEINTFYIENLDLLRTRYGIATNNVAAEDVATVQVLQNHQPIKALDSINPGQSAAINLKLKESAKNKLSYMIRAGIGGTPLLWNNELAGMIFAPRFQNITTYKNNNTGKDLSLENQRFNWSMDLDSESLTNVIEPTSPGLQPERYLFNNSHQVTVNNLFKTDSVTTVAMNVSYLYNKDKRSGSKVTSYLLPGNKLLLVNEETNSHTTTNKLNAGLQYRKNAENHYFENSTDFAGKWDDSKGLISNGQDMLQTQNQSTISLFNHLEWTGKITKSRGYRLKSDIQFKSSPEQLTVTPGVFPEFLNQNQPYDALTQYARVNKLNFLNRIELLSAIKLPNFMLSPTLELNAQYRNINSQLSIMNQGVHDEFTADSLQNNQDILQSNAILDINSQYIFKKVRIKLILPLEYRSILLFNRINDQRELIGRLLFNPQLVFNYTLNSNWSFATNYYFRNSMGSLLSFYEGYILTGYRNLNRNNGQINETKSNILGLNIIYSNNNHNFELNLGLDYRQYKSNLIYGQNLLGALVVNTVVQNRNRNDMGTISFNATKGFRWKNLQLNVLNVVYLSGSQQYQSGQLIPFRSMSINTIAGAYLVPFDFMTLRYNTFWRIDKIMQSSVSRPFQTFNEELTTTFNLPCNFVFSLKAKHYYYSENTSNKNLLFLDLELTKVINKIHLSLDCNNILNYCNFNMGYLDAINSYQYSYRIRPREVLLKVAVHLK